MDKKQQQVADQCRAVAHMATAIADIYSDLASMHADGAALSLVETHGARSHRLMELLGDLLNDMDAVDNDEWLDRVFDGARATFPIDKIAAE